MLWIPQKSFLSIKELPYVVQYTVIGYCHPRMKYTDSR